MMHFFHQYLLYVTFEVLEPLWLSLQSAIRAATTLDQVIEHHRSFLGRSLAGTVLRSKMVRNLTELKVLVYDFAKTSERLDVDTELLEPEPLDRNGAPPLPSPAIAQVLCLQASASACSSEAHCGDREGQVGDTQAQGAGGGGGGERAGHPLHRPLLGQHPGPGREV